MTDRHHQSGDNYGDDDPQNQIGGIIPSFSLSGWLRHGMEAVVQERGGTACHPGESNANFMKNEVYERDLDAGYHPKGECVESDDTSDEGCVIHDLYGGFGGIPGKFMRRPIQFSPVRNSVDYTRGQAEGHYRRINRNVTTMKISHTQLEHLILRVAVGVICYNDEDITYPVGTSGTSPAAPTTGGYNDEDITYPVGTSFPPRGGRRSRRGYNDEDITYPVGTGLSCRDGRAISPVTTMKISHTQLEPRDFTEWGVGFGRLQR